MNTIGRFVHRVWELGIAVGQRVLRERPTTEHLLLIGLLAGSLYMIWEAQSFEPASRRFPQLTGATAAVLASVLLARNYLPAPLQTLLLSDDSEDETDDQTTAQYTYDLDNYRGPTAIIALSFVYLGLAATVGLLLATPVFVLLYCLWAEVTWPKSTVLIVMSAVIAVGFYLLVSPSVGEGWYTGWAPPVPLPSSISGVIQWL